jgi:hypothetical protein
LRRRWPNGLRRAVAALGHCGRWTLAVFHRQAAILPLMGSIMATCAGSRALGMIAACVLAGGLRCRTVALVWAQIGTQYLLSMSRTIRAEARSRRDPSPSPAGAGAT